MRPTTWAHVGRAGVEPHQAQPNMHDAYTPSWGGREAPCMFPCCGEAVREQPPLDLRVAAVRRLGFLR